jgi:hypothetical protein
MSGKVQRSIIKIQDVIDQTAHVLQGAAIVLPFLFLRPVIAAPLSAFVGMFWRELTQLRRSERFKAWKMDRPYPSEKWWVAWNMTDHLVDLAFGTLGGLIVGLIIR